MKKLYFLAVLSALVLLYSGCVVENEEPPRPVELVISEQPTKVEYKKGDELDLSGLKVTLKKSDDTSEVLEKGKYTAVPSDGTVLAEPGKKTVTITAEGLSATFTITVTATKRLEISKQPTKMGYEKGDKLDLSGLEITLHKTDGTSELLTEYKTVPSDRTVLAEPGKKTVTITAEGLSATFTITVTEPEEKPDVSAVELVISKQPTKVSYEKGDKLNLSGLEITLHKTDGTSELLTEYKTVPEEGTELTASGEKTVTVTAEGLSATFTITVTAPEGKPDEPTDRLEISKQPTKVGYEKGDKLDLSGLEVTLHKADGTSEVLEEGRYTAEPEEGTELTEPGEKTVRITAEGLSATFTITVTAPEEKPDVSAVELVISEQPTKTVYKKGDELDLSGLEVTLKKSDGTSEVLEEGEYTAVPKNGSKLTELGKQPVKIMVERAEGLEATFNICVAGLKIVRKPWKTNYSFYTLLDLNGLEVKLYRTDGTSNELDWVQDEELTTEPESLSVLAETGELTVTISAEELTETFKISVSDEYIASNYGQEVSLALSLPSIDLEEANKCYSIVKRIKVVLDGTYDSYVITDGAFQDCSSLTSIEIPEGVTRIGRCAFQNCSSLTSIEIPEGVTSIENQAFENCSSLTSIEIPDNADFSNKNWVFKNCSKLESVKIGSSATSIGFGLFENCSNLKSVEIPSKVNLIYAYAFYGCTSLKSVTIPAGVTRIGENAFTNCNNLESITYKGSKAQWNEIEVDKQWEGGIGKMSEKYDLVGLKGKKIVCTGGEEIQY